MAVQFYKAAQAVIADVERHPEVYPELHGSDLRKLLKKAHVLVSDKPVYVSQGQIQQEDTATNYPATRTIVLNGTTDDYAWVKISDAHIMEALALHELLSLSGVESTGNYSVSNRYLRAKGVPCYQGLCTPTPIVEANLTPEADEAIDSPLEGEIILKNPHFKSAVKYENQHQFLLSVNHSPGTPEEFCKFFGAFGGYDRENSEFGEDSYQFLAAFDSDSKKWTMTSNEMYYYSELRCKKTDFDPNKLVKTSLGKNECDRNPSCATRTDKENITEESGALSRSATKSPAGAAVAE